MFRENIHSNLDEMISAIRPLVDKFYEYTKLDEKPEKGERKMADEQVLLIADMID
jgi:hypothetical protein